MEKNNVKIQKGYTLIEMLVVIAIISIVLPVLSATIISLYDTHSRTLSRALVLVDTTKAVKAVVRDVRSAVYAENGALPVVAIATSSLTLFADTDFDGKVERVRYFLDNTTMRKGVIEPTSTSSYPSSTETVEDFVSNIVNLNSTTPIFRYYTSTSSEITDMSNTLEVRRIEVEFIGSSRIGSHTSEVPFRSSASIRNLKESY